MPNANQPDALQSALPPSARRLLATLGVYVILAQGILIASLHVAFLYWMYGSRFFGLAVPNGVALALWLGISSTLALGGYYCILRRAIWPRTSISRWVASAVATLVSLYLGVFLAFTTYGI